MQGRSIGYDGGVRMISFIIGLLIGTVGVGMIAANTVYRITSKIDEYIRALDRGLPYTTELALKKLREITGAAK